MSELEKQTKHNIIVRLLSETPITYDAALFQLAKSIDKETLEENDMLLLGFDSYWLNDTEPETHTQKESGPSKLMNLARRFPGPIGDLLKRLKGTSARNLYIGFCGTVLLGILLYKWFIRLVTGTF